METLESPLKRHIMGAYPKYSLTKSLHQNFQGLEQPALQWMLMKLGYMSAEGKIAKQAATDGLVAVCDGKPLWNLEVLTLKLQAVGDRPERKPVNQVITRSSTGEPQWVNLGTVGTYFSATSVLVGRWLDALELRDEEGMATKDALERGLATTVEMSAGPKKTRKITQWNLELVQEILMEAGHPLDFDYEGSLKGKGKNSDVKVETVESRARVFAKEFAATFKDPVARRGLPAIVKKTPKPIQKLAEEMLKRPGFITQGLYLKSLDRE